MLLKQEKVPSVQVYFFRIRSVTAPICFICPTKFSNSALLFGSYFDVLVCASLCFSIFARFVSTPNFRHNAQLFCFFAEF